MALTLHDSQPDETLYRIQFERPELGTEVCSDVQIAVHGMPETVICRKRPEDIDEIEPYVQTTLRSHHCFNPAKLKFIWFFVSSPPDVIEMEVPATLEQRNGKRTQVLYALMKLLERKDALLTALRGLNDRADTTVQQWEQAYPGTARPPFHPNFQSQYAWVAHNIDVTNRALRPAIQQLQYMLEAQDLNSSRRTVDIKPSADTKRLLEQLWEEKLESARVLVDSIASQGSSDDSASPAEATDSEVRA